MCARVRLELVDGWDIGDEGDEKNSNSSLTNVQQSEGLHQTADIFCG